MGDLAFMVKCGDCDFYIDDSNSVKEFDFLGECFLGEIEKFDEGRQSRLGVKLVGKAKKPCGLFVFKINDNTFLTEV